MHPLLLLSMVSTLSASPLALRPVPAGPEAPIAFAPAGDAEAACDDGTAGGTLVQRSDDYYGNRFVAPCSSAHVLGASFTHFGYGLEGAYAYRLHLLDGSCRELGVTPLLTVSAAALSPSRADVDLASLGWCIDGAFHLLLEPLTCADGLEGRDCFPALEVDSSSDADAAAHCAIVSAPTADGRQCLAARSSDGRWFDFRLRVQVACNAPECATATHPGSWSQVKLLYRDTMPVGDN